MSKRITWSQRIDGVAQLDELDGGCVDVCLVWAQVSADIDFKSQVCEHLLRMSPRSLAFGGKECRSWEDIADEIHVMRIIDLVAEDSLLLTTSHPDESGAEVVEFLVLCCLDQERSVAVLVVGPRGDYHLELEALLKGYLGD